MNSDDGYNQLTEEEVQSVIIRSKRVYLLAEIKATETLIALNLDQLEKLDEMRKKAQGTINNGGLSSDEIQRCNSVVGLLTDRINQINQTNALLGQKVEQLKRQFDALH